MTKNEWIAELARNPDPAAIAAFARRCAARAAGYASGVARARYADDADRAERAAAFAASAAERATDASDAAASAYEAACYAADASAYAGRVGVAYDARDFYGSASRSAERLVQLTDLRIMREEIV